MDKKVKDILEKFEKSGYQAYIVGGYVRDYVLGIESKDIDIATNATPTEIKKIFSFSKCTGDNRFGNVNIGDIQITTFRQDIYQKNSRFPQVCYVNSTKEDVLRRDFTINALYMDKNENIIDYVGGIDDIKYKIIRTIKDPSTSLCEDPLRIVRALRFSKMLNFTLDSSLEKAIEDQKDLIKKISKTRVQKEIEKGKNYHFTMKDIELLLKK